MKHFTLSLLAAASVTLAAQAAPEAPVPVASPEGHAELQQPVAVPRIAPSYKAPSKEFSFDTDSLIYEAPAGEVKHYIRDGYFWFPYGQSMVFDTRSNIAAELVEGDDGYVYIKNPYTNFESNSYLKGKREGDSIKVTLPQAIYREPNLDVPGEYNTYYACIMVEEYSGSDYYLMTEETELVYRIEDDKIILDLGYDPTPDPWGMPPYPYKVLGLVTDEGIWMSEAEALQTWVPFDDQAITLPEGVTSEQWALTADGGGQMVKVAIDGNDFYIGQMYAPLGDGWFKGTLADGKVTFASGQFLGTANGNYLFMHGVKFNAEGGAVAQPDVTFDYNADTKTLTVSETDCGICFSSSKTSIKAVKTWRNPMFRLQPDDIDLTPLTPTFIEYFPYNEETGSGSFRFNLPSENKDGYILDVDSMYYNVYFNGELETFYVDEYPRLEDDMTNVPYTFADGWNFYALGTVHVVYYYSRGVNTIGVKLCNKRGGKVYESPVMTLDLATGEQTSSGSTAINDVTIGRQPVGVEWYDLTGARVTSPATGLYICKTIFSDGSVTTSKVVR